MGVAICRHGRTRYRRVRPPLCGLLHALPPKRLILPDPIHQPRPNRVRRNGRPAVVLSYCIAAIMAFVSAMTFVEMSVDYPLAGSSFNYVLAVMGEFPAWCACPVARCDTSSSGPDLVRCRACWLPACRGVHASARRRSPATINVPTDV